MSAPIVFGASYSVYVRSVRLVLEEKGAAYRLIEVDVFAPGGPPAEHLARQPFGRIPAFEHDGFRLYETGAIIRYIDEVIPGPQLRPKTAKARARVDQVISILDNYAYRPLVREIFVERVRAPAKGQEPNEAVIASALMPAATCLQALEELMDGGPYLAGQDLTLADLHAAPMFVYFSMAREGSAMLSQREPLRRWWQRMSVRPSVVATRSPLE
jgi:glutathione S-transferase